MDESIVSIAIGAIGLGYVVYVRSSVRQHETGLFVTAVLLGGAPHVLDLSHGFLIRALQPPLWGRSPAQPNSSRTDSSVVITAYFARAVESNLRSAQGNSGTGELRRGR